MPSQYGVRIDAQGMDAFVAEMSKGGAGTDALTNAASRLGGALPGVAAGLGRTQEEARKAAERMRDLGAAKETASASTSKFSSNIGQAGFQLQDFAVQVQGGTSALTAFGQQAPQFLGIFGPAGAIAGAVVAVGALAAGILLGADNAKELQKSGETAFKAMADGAKAVKDVLADINSLFQTATERAATASRARVAELEATARQQLSILLLRQDEAAGDKAKAEADIRRLEALQARNAELRARQQRAGVTLDQDATGTEVSSQLFTARAAIQGSNAYMDRLGGRIGELTESLNRLANAGVVGVHGEYGPPAPDKPTRTRVDRTAEREAARFDLTHYDTPVINPATGLLSFGGDDDKTQAAIRRNTDLAARANERNAEQQRRALEQQERAAERSTDAIVRYGADAFADMTGKNTKGWAGFLEGLEATAKRTFARIAAEAIIRPVVTPLVQGFLGSGGGNLYQGLATTFGFGGVAQLFGGSSGAGIGSTRGGFDGGSAPITISGDGAGQPRVNIGGGGVAGGGGGVSLMDAGGGLYKIVNGGGVGSAAMPGAISTFLNTPIYTTQAGMAATAPLAAGVQGPVASITDPGMGLTYGGALGAGASIVGGAYGVYSGLQRGGVGGYTTAAGGAVGIASGAVAAGVGTGLIGASSTLAMLGPYGMVAAAVLAIIGSLLPGAKPSNKTGTAAIDLGSGATDIYGQTGSKFSQANRDSANSLAQGVKALTDSIGKLTGTQPQGRVTVDVGSRDGLGLAVSTPGGGTRMGYHFAADDDGQAELMRTVGALLLDEMSARMPTAVARAVEGVSRQSTEAILTGLAKIAEATNGGKPTANQNIAAQNIDFGNLDAGLADLKWAGTTYDSLTAPKVQAFEQQLTDLAAAWNDNIARASRLGLATDALAEAFATAQAELVKTVDDARRALIDPVLARQQIAQTGSNFGAQMFLADRAREVELDTYRKQLVQLGAGGDDLEMRVQQLRDTQGAERADTIAQRDQSLAGMVNGLAVRGLQSRNDPNAALAAFDFNGATEWRTFYDQLTALGASAETVAEQMQALGVVQTAERQNLVKSLADQATATEKAKGNTARGLLEQLAIGDLGGLTGETRYFAGMQSLNAAKRGLADGTPEAVSEYARVAQLVLPVLRDFLGTSETFGAISADVAGTLARAAPGGDVANLATLIEATSTGTDQLTTTLLSTSGVTNELLGRIQTDIARLTGQIAAVMARAA